MSYKFSLMLPQKQLVSPFSCYSYRPVFAQYNFHDLDQEWEARQKLLGKDAVIMLANKDTIIYKKEVGDFNAKTVAPIASCSKWLTAALVMQFVDEGKLSLDDKIGKWLPEFDKYGKSYITIRLCLSHMTGIEDEGSLLKKLFERKKIFFAGRRSEQFCRKGYPCQRRHRFLVWQYRVEYSGP